MISWKRRVGACAGLSLLFLVVYSWCNSFTAQREDVGVIYFAWERHIPFVPWMTIPYLSIDLFFIAAPFLVTGRDELREFCQRIIFVIVVAGLSYLVFPLTLAVERPVIEGPLGVVWAWFIGMDQPHNLMPSLHIALRTILAAVYARHLTGKWHLAVAFWFSLIGLSTLLTYQHHFIDVFTGFLLGLLANLVIREGMFRRHPEQNRFMSRFYAGLSGIVLLLLALGWPSSFWLLWPVLSFALAALAYAGFLAVLPRKEKGRLLFADRLLWAPVLFGQWLSWHYYRKKSSRWNRVAPGVILGRLLVSGELPELEKEGVRAVLDLTGEFSETPGLLKLEYLNIPLRDLTAPSFEEMSLAADFIHRHAGSGVYVHCKAGYSRSVAAVGAYLLKSGLAPDAAAAETQIRLARPDVVIRPEISRALRIFESLWK
jgi:membrane-associated phospholipid phosphatase